MGPETDMNCMLLIQDILEPIDYFYVCTENPKHLQALLLVLNELLDRLPIDETAAFTRILNED